MLFQSHISSAPSHLPLGEDYKPKTGAITGLTHSPQEQEPLLGAFGACEINETKEHLPVPALKPFIILITVIIILLLLLIIIVITIAIMVLP